MGYLIKGIDIEKIVVTIPQADVQLMDTMQPFTLVQTNTNFIAVPFNCLISIADNQTTPYTGFNHLHLTNSNNFTAGDLCASFDANAAGPNNLETDTVYSMLCSFQNTPNRFGGFNKNRDLQIFFDTLPTAGDGDMIVTLYYVRITI